MHELPQRLRNLNTKCTFLPEIRSQYQANKSVRRWVPHVLTRTSAVWTNSEWIKEKKILSFSVPNGRPRENWYRTSSRSRRAVSWWMRMFHARNDFPLFEVWERGLYAGVKDWRNFRKFVTNSAITILTYVREDGPSSYERRSPIRSAREGLSMFEPGGYEFGPFESRPLSLSNT